MFSFLRVLLVLPLVMCVSMCLCMLLYMVCICMCSCALAYDFSLVVDKISRLVHLDLRPWLMQTTVTIGRVKCFDYQ